MYPTMTFRNYIRKHAEKTQNGRFYCDLCEAWINAHRWMHFKRLHRYAKTQTLKEVSV